MKHTVVIPCYNEIATIRAIVDAVRAAPYPDKQIIIVDDCSTDGMQMNFHRLGGCGEGTDGIRRLLSIRFGDGRLR